MTISFITFLLITVTEAPSSKSACIFLREFTPMIETGNFLKNTLYNQLVFEFSLFLRSEGLTGAAGGLKTCSSFLNSFQLGICFSSGREKNVIIYDADENIDYKTFFPYQLL